MTWKFEKVSEFHPGELMGALVLKLYGYSKRVFLTQFFVLLEETFVHQNTLRKSLLLSFWCVEHKISPSTV
uniref:Uncharacterized protein n=1 Tax=Romanomermis culicivorax TaxID=13658 RepID=A0A915KTM0_ROMCU